MSKPVPATRVMVVKAATEMAEATVERVDPRGARWDRPSAVKQLATEIAQDIDRQLVNKLSRRPAGGR